MAGVCLSDCVKSKAEIHPDRAHVWWVSILAESLWTRPQNTPGGRGSHRGPSGGPSDPGDSLEPSRTGRDRGETGETAGSVWKTSGRCQIARPGHVVTDLIVVSRNFWVGGADLGECEEVLGFACIFHVLYVHIIPTISYHYTYYTKTGASKMSECKLPVSCEILVSYSYRVISPALGTPTARLRGHSLHAFEVI